MHPRAALWSRCCDSASTEVMEELTGAQLIAEALKAQVSVVMLKVYYLECSKATEPLKRSVT